MRVHNAAAGSQSPAALPMDDAALVALVESAGAPPPIDVHSGPRGRRGGGRGREDRVESLQAEADAHATRGDALADAVCHVAN